MLSELQFVAAESRLDIGDPKGPLAGWLNRGTEIQRLRRESIAGVVSYCRHQAVLHEFPIPDEVENSPTDAAKAHELQAREARRHWHQCDESETQAMVRVQAAHGYRDIDQQVLTACLHIPDHESYVAIERCVWSELKSRQLPLPQTPRN